MEFFRQDFTQRQYMVTPHYEYFHYRDKSTIEVEYHNHDFYEIYYLVSGKVTYMIEGKAYKLNPHDFVIINNSELHKPIIESSEEYERIVIWVKPDFLKKHSLQNSNLTMCFESPTHQSNNLLRLSPETHVKLLEILNKFEKACYGISFGNDILKNIYLIEVLVYLNKAFVENYEQKINYEMDYNEEIGEIIEYINENLSSKLSLDSIAATFYMSKYHLLREFKKYTGYTVYKYILQKRIILAKQLLNQSLPLLEVCVLTGFPDYSNFIRTFKKECGISPGKYNKATR